MGSVIETNVVCQIGLVVNDVEKTGQAFADFFGIERPEIADSGPDEIVKAEVYGERSTASCKMMFFDTPTVQIELMRSPAHGGIFSMKRGRDFITLPSR